MERRKLSTIAKPFISQFTRKAQVSTTEEKLTKALVKKQDHDDEIKRQHESSDDQWRRLFEADEQQIQSNADSEDAELNQAGRRVLLAWLKFQKSVPEHESINLRDKPPNFSVLYAAVESVQVSLEGKRASSTVKARFRKICAGMNDYEYLAKPIPSDDKYVSIVTGTIGALIKATVNHEDIANGISEGLANIADDISYWVRLLEQHSDNPKMKSYIRELYTIVFECFADIFTEWHKSRWTRIIGSFNQNLLKKIVLGHRERMKDLSNKLMREAALDKTAAFSSFTTDFNRFVDENQENQRLLGIRQNEDRAEYRTFMKTLSEEGMRVWQQELQLWLTGGAGQQFLESAFINMSSVQPPQQLQQRPRTASPASRTASAERNLSQIGSSSTTYTRAQLQAYTQQLGLKTSRTHAEMPMFSAADLNIPSSVFDALKIWSSGSGSQYLWIEGPSDVETPSQVTLTSMSLVGIAQRSKTAYVAYFAQQSNARKMADRPQQCSQAFRSLVHTLVSQLVDQVPAGFETEADFSEDRFACLASTDNDLKSAMHLLQDVLEVMTGPLLCLVDGLQYLAYGASREIIASLRDLIGLLCDRNNFRYPVMRVCLTTDGYVEALARGPIKTLLERVSCDDDDDGSFEYTMDDLT